MLPTLQAVLLTFSAVCLKHLVAQVLPNSNLNFEPCSLEIKALLILLFCTKKKKASYTIGGKAFSRWQKLKLSNIRTRRCLYEAMFTFDRSSPRMSLQKQVQERSLQGYFYNFAQFGGSSDCLNFDKFHVTAPLKHAEQLHKQT